MIHDLSKHDPTDRESDARSNETARIGDRVAGAQRQDAVAGTTHRRDLLRALGAGAVGAVAGSAAGSSAIASSHGERRYENPLYGPDFADPTIHRADDGTWWAYASNMSYGQDSEEMLVPILSSPDLVNWTYEGEAFRSRPGWTYGSIWAPDVHYHDGQWVLFYSLWPRNDGEDDQTGIGVATSDAPDGPFTDHGKILTNPEHPYPGNTIDPYFVEHEGTPYLFWGNFAGVYYVELTADLTAFRPGTFGQIVGSAYEGSTIFRRDGYWYFFGSTGDCCDGYDSTYEIEVGRSESFLGPYYDRAGTPMLERDEWNAGPTHLGDGDRFVGPGHGDVTVDDDGAHWFVYHAYDTEGPENAGEYGWPPARQLFLDRIYWTDDGWPVIGGDGTPSASAPVPNLGQRAAPVEAGTYRVANVESGNRLAVEGAGDGASAVVVAPETAGSDAEWQVSRLAGGEYAIEHAASGQLLEVEGGDTADGADVQQWPANGHPAQRWHVSEDGAGYRLENACSGSVAEVADAATAPGSNVQQWSWNAGDHQRWRFEPVDDAGACEGAADAGGSTEIDGRTVCDVDGDGLHRDVTGDGTVGQTDVVQFFERQHREAWKRPELFDFSGNGSVGHGDVVSLFEHVATRT